MGMLLRVLYRVWCWSCWLQCSWWWRFVTEYSYTWLLSYWVELCIFENYKKILDNHLLHMFHGVHSYVPNHQGVTKIVIKIAQLGHGNTRLVLKDRSYQMWLFLIKKLILFPLSLFRLGRGGSSSIFGCSFTWPRVHFLLCLHFVIISSHLLRVGFGSAIKIVNFSVRQRSHW